ncbi:hypothetical protein L2750_06060 [Shewanella submarina]|uniref:Uncharacterized protein n=1 Tax=Shewanella submarina TaxID=2016376 RepID=A0ABV7GCB4_9GAMM|nr:hypothetical protein [Shewanella submarina]MCL1036714.1 hypothetical protein [Shewanella submarina]
MQAEATTKPYHARLAKLEQALSVMHTIVSKEMVMPGVDEPDDDIEQQILMMLLKRAMSKEDCIPEMAVEFVQGFLEQA